VTNGTGLITALIRAFMERRDVASSSPPRPGAPAPTPASPGSARAAAPAADPRVHDPVDLFGVAAPPLGRTPPAASAEGGLVRALFATPQTVAAAFIASEVFALPVALRDR
jgi:hypothetical protein